MKEIFQTLKQEIKTNYKLITACPMEVINIIFAFAGVFGFLWVVMFIYNQLV
jgi:hypothetical protein